MLVRTVLFAAAAAVALGLSRENSAKPHPLYVWSSHEGPAQVNLTDAKIRPFGNDFAVWNFRRQLSVTDVDCNMIYLLGKEAGWCTASDSVNGACCTHRPKPHIWPPKLRNISHWRELHNRVPC